MQTLLSLFATLARLLRPARGLHAAPRAIRRDVRDEARAARVRRYAILVPAPDPTVSAAATSVAPAIPAPRRAPDDVPRGYAPVAAPLADVAAEPDCIVRGYYMAHERRREHARVDGDRLGLAVLADIARTANTVVPV